MIGEHVSSKTLQKILKKISRKIKNSENVREMGFYIMSEPGSFTISDRLASGEVVSDICIDIRPLFLYKNDDFVDDMLVGQLITQCFHEKHHAYQNAVIDTGRCRMTQHNKEIANMGVVCEFFPVFYKAGYKTDVRETDAEMAGIMDAKEYCEKYLPNFDYDSAILRYARESEFAIISGDFKDLDELLDAGERKLHMDYYKTRGFPAYRIPNDSGEHCDRMFVMKCDCDRVRYTGTPDNPVPGHEQIVMMFDTLLEASFAEEVKERCPAVRFRYDLSLKEKYERKQLQRMIETDMELGLSDNQSDFQGDSNGAEKH